MRCPKCLELLREEPGRLSVLRTRDLGNAVERDRGCPLCGHKLVTIERDVCFVEGLLAQAERVAYLEDLVYETRGDEEASPDTAPRGASPIRDAAPQGAFPDEPGRFHRRGAW